jgi:hypothetical protein
VLSVFRPIADLSDISKRFQGTCKPVVCVDQKPRAGWSWGIIPCVAVDIGVAILLAVVVGVLTLLGGLLAAKTSVHRKMFWALGVLGVVLTVTQAVRQAQSQDASLKTVTGGDSFCFVRLEVGNEGVYPIVLSSGRYPLYDLSMRLWDPEEWKTASVLSVDAVWPKTAAETFQLGTLPNDDYRNAHKIPLPATDKIYAVEFSARNGSWSQTVWVRRSIKGWKTASLVRHSQRVGKAPVLGPKMCLYVDQDFPLQSPDEVKNWAQDVPACVVGSHP